MDINAMHKAAEERVAQAAFAAAQIEYDAAAKLAQETAEEEARLFKEAHEAVNRHKAFKDKLLEAGGLLTIAKDRLDKAAQARYGIGKQPDMQTRMDAAAQSDMAERFSPRVAVNNG